MERKYMPDDKVQYTGGKFSAELAGQLGWVIAPIQGSPNQYVVEFAGDDYRMHASFLAPATDLVKKEDKSGAEKIAGVEIRRNRRRAAENEE
jgi:hypothetical protein